MQFLVPCKIDNKNDFILIITRIMIVKKYLYVLNDELIENIVSLKKGIHDCFRKVFY